MPSLAPGTVYDWHPARLVQKQPRIRPAPYAVVVLNQPLTDWERVRTIWERASYRVAADGGANRLLDLVWARSDASLITLDAIVGDLDSLRDEARAYFAFARILHDPNQYSTDFGKAVNHIQTAHPGIDVVVLGGIGGRVDQGVSQLHHLYVFQAEDEQNHGTARATRHTFLLSSDSLTFLLPAGRHRIHVPAVADHDEEAVFAKHVGFLPLRGPSTLTTHGLEWDVADWPTQFGGNLSSSNHVLPATRVVEAETDQPIVFTIALQNAE